MFDFLIVVALGGLCAAASAAAIELLPLVPHPEMQSLLAVVFPSGAALFAAAASVSKVCTYVNNYFEKNI